jgi:hypothetical protein
MSFRTALGPTQHFLSCDRETHSPRMKGQVVTDSQSHPPGAEDKITKRLPSLPRMLPR